MDKARRAQALTASLAAHACVLAAILWRLGAAPPLAEPPTLEVRIVPPWTTYRPPPPPRPAEPARSTPGATAPPLLHRPAEAATPDVPAAPWAAPAAGEDIGPALRALLGCDRAGLMQLTAEEREGCRRRLAAARPTDFRPGRIKLDPAGRMAEDSVPYLARRPHNECKPMAGGSVTPSGEQGVAFGIGCEWDF